MIEKTIYRFNDNNISVEHDLEDKSVFQIAADMLGVGYSELFIYCKRYPNQVINIYKNIAETKENIKISERIYKIEKIRDGQRTKKINN